MPENVEFKACLTSRRIALDKLESLSSGQPNTSRQRDSYLKVTSGILKVREWEDETSELIHYERLATPSSRSSTFAKFALEPPWSSALIAFLSSALGTYAVVEKARTTFHHDCALIHVDLVDRLGEFIEVEVERECSGGLQEARKIALDLKDRLHIKQADLVPWSYADLLTLNVSAERWRTSLGVGRDWGRVVLVDGASATGKTTLVNELTALSEVRIVKRLTTRTARHEDSRDHQQMVHVSCSEFRRLVMEGELVEFRDFLFGMSYGLPWSPFVEAAHEGKTSVGLINLGNGPHIKRYWPEATTVLIDAPLEDIKRRLVDRQSHTDEQIEERLANARLAKEYRESYDFVVDNPDSALETSFTALREIVRPAESQ